MATANPTEVQPPSENLKELARAALDVAKKAKKNNKGLNGDNFYANKLATIRADATNAFRLLSSVGGQETATVAKQIEVTFAADTPSKQRTLAARELEFNLKTHWHGKNVPREDEGLFPLSILSDAKRGYLVTIGRQMNGCFTSGWYDAASVMMRRLIEIAIIGAFEGKALASKITDKSGNYFQLSDLITKTLAETAWKLSRNAIKALPLLRDVGHMSAHGRYFTAKKEDVEALKPGCRVVVEELLHHAGLL